VHIPREEFERLVARAIDGLPPEFAGKLDNVEFVVEDDPVPQDYDGHAIAPRSLLLGLYHGVPRTRRSPFDSGLLPDQITIFQRNVEQVCRTRREIVECVRRTVLHEIGHHLGISEQRLRELGC
jgi:predicted Zn-dependent protease with MMP-like domain